MLQVWGMVNGAHGPEKPSLHNCVDFRVEACQSVWLIHTFYSLGVSWPAHSLSHFYLWFWSSVMCRSKSSQPCVHNSFQFAKIIFTNTAFLWLSRFHLLPPSPPVFWQSNFARLLILFHKSATRLFFFWYLSFPDFFLVEIAAFKIDSYEHFVYVNGMNYNRKSGFSPDKSEPKDSMWAPHYSTPSLP